MNRAEQLSKELQEECEKSGLKYLICVADAPDKPECGFHVKVNLVEISHKGYRTKYAAVMGMLGLFLKDHLCGR